MTKKTIIKLLSEKPQTVFAPPQQEICIYENNIFEKLNIEKLKQIILKKENKIKLNYPSFDDGNTGLGNNSLTSRYPYYNLFQWPEISNMKEIVKNNYIDFLNYLNTQRQKT